MGKIVDLTRQRFGRLIVIEKAGHSKGNRLQWLCKCDCGNFKITTSSDLKSGKVRSCGCLRKETTSKMAKSRSKSRIKHNKSNTRIYRIWSTMKQRCYNSKCFSYKWYGKKGIKICDEWKNNFIFFYNWAIDNGYKENLSIDRIDVNGNYEPSNCRWVDNIIQQNNKTNNKIIIYKNKKYTMSQLSKILNLKYCNIKYRLKANWKMEELDNKKEEDKLNKIFLIGNICNDLEIKETANSKILSFNLAVQRKFKNQNGEYESDFFRLKAFNNQATFIQKYFNKGSKIVIEAHMQNNNYEDENGQKHYSNDIIVDQVEFCGSKKETQEPKSDMQFENEISNMNFDNEPLPF